MTLSTGNGLVISSDGSFTSFSCLLPVLLNYIIAVQFLEMLVCEQQFTVFVRRSQMHSDAEERSSASRQLQVKLHHVEQQAMQKDKQLQELELSLLQDNEVGFMSYLLIYADIHIYIYSFL